MMPLRWWEQLSIFNKSIFQESGENKDIFRQIGSLAPTALNKEKFKEFQAKGKWKV